jgi:alkylation response protein AidB-like acyl-CoA dehydrogenase
MTDVIAAKATGVFTSEQEELRDSARRFLSERSSSDAVRELMETEHGFDRETWKQMAELGWLGLSIPEEFGGLGYGFVELFVLLEEMGRVLLPAPFFSSVILSGGAIQDVGTEQQKKELLSEIAAGTMRAALCIAEPSGRWDSAGIATRAGDSAHGPVLDGTKTYVIDGYSADLLIVAARTREDAESIALFTVDPNQDGVECKLLDSLDPTRKQAEIRLSNVRGELLGDENAWPALSQTLDRALVALAGEAVGGAQQCLQTTAEYTKQRTQFDRPIGSFQAIQHRLADLFMEVEMARSAAYYAAWSAAEAAEELSVVAPIAKGACTEAFFHAAAEAIQIHGGIGFTWEHDAHLYFKRAKSSQLLFGDTTHQRELLARRIGI